MTKNVLFDSFIIEFIFFIFYKLFEQPKYLIIFSNCKISIFQMVKKISKFLNFENSIIFHIEQFRIFDHFSNSSIIANWEIW